MSEETQSETLTETEAQPSPTEKQMEKPERAADLALFNDAGPPATTRERPNPLWSMPVSALMKLADLPMMALHALAKSLADSDLVPERLFKRPANVFMVLMKGAELGVSASVALAEIMIVEGKLTISSHLQNALVQRSGKMKIWRIIESTEERAVMEVQRHEWDKSTTVEFTAEEAKKLGLTTRGKNPQYSPWNTQRANMLRRRVVTRAAREHAGDVVIAYDHDEIETPEERELTAAPSWGKAPVIEASHEERTEYTQAWTADVPTEAAPEKPAPTLPPSGEQSDVQKLLASFTECCERAKTPRDVNVATTMLKPLYALANNGDKEAKAALEASEALLAKHGRRTRESSK